ncbi:hypothetical protein HPB51_027956 [Rhipicephalus microplus]|uniref:Uncharacterized protein n=1 Tax=Rhipicephalus microplus TaxID=6941 RepID=A0A9J6CYH2_RHIMP|nr:hypothetical protein HPB51_027956 [Rhipicephalus microplus]
MKLHWLAFDVTKDAIRRAFYEYGDVKEVTDDRWRVEDFEGVESTTRVIRMQLRDGVSVDQLPHQVRIGSSTALVVVPGRPPCACGAEVRGICDAIVRSQGAANATLSVMSRTSVTVHTHELQGDDQRLNRVNFSWMRRNRNKRLCLRHHRSRRHPDDTPVLKKSKQVSSALDTNA